MLKEWSGRNIFTFIGLKSLNVLHNKEWDQSSAKNHGIHLTGEKSWKGSAMTFDPQ